jgi:hypothetical protein
MVTASQGFIRRVKDRADDGPRPSVGFFISTVDEDEDGNEIEVRRDDFTATMPGDEQLLVMVAEGGREGATVADEVAALLDFFRAALPAAQYRLLFRRFKDPQDPDVDFETLQDIFQWLMEQWQDFPTQQPAGSSKSSGSTGTKSTGRVRGKGSTR